jgi:SAM-dependent methyltransferase
MDDATARALRELNRRFYDERAHEFSATRGAPWPGWTRLVPHLRALGTGAAPLRVLDVGCGNGRFGRFLADAIGATRRGLTIHGVEASGPLLEIALENAPDAVDCHWHLLDFVESASDLPEGPFDCIALFGALHEVPSRERRRALLRALSQRLARGGVLALSCWRFAELPRFQRRLVPWESWNATSRHAPLSLDQLEPGDHIVPWRDGSTARYAHAVSQAELSELVEGLPLTVFEVFLDDGRERNLNRHVFFRGG